MKNNIFLRSTRRQPIRTALLLLLIVLITFAFTARAAEYLLVNQEIDRLGGYYKSAGEISWLGGSRNPDNASFDEAKQFLENDPRVAHTNWTQWLSVVLQDMYNADVHGVGSSVKCKNGHYYFTGTLLGISEVRGYSDGRPYASNIDGDWDVSCYFRQEQSMAGAPELVWEGQIVRVRILQKNVRDVLETLTVGKQYLVCGSVYYTYRPDGDIVIEKPTVKNPDPDEPWQKWENTKPGDQFTAVPLAEGAPLFYAVPEDGEIDWGDPALAGVEEELRICREEQSALQVLTTKDMDTMEEIRPDRGIYLVDGRWLTHEDDSGQNRVCMIHDEMAKLRGLSVGDTITLKLRDISAEDYQWGYILFPFMKDYETAMETFQIVGTYNNVRPDDQGFHVRRNIIYIPDSAVPENFHSFDPWLDADLLRFALTSPNVTEEFIADTRDALAEMSLQVKMWDNGWDDFQTAVRPMRQSSLYNLILFALILLTALCVVAFFYFRARRRDVAIARALGVPAGACVRQGAFPLAMIGLVGTAFGAVLGWQYALNRGAKTLASLSAYGEGAAEIALPRYWLAVIFGGVFLLVFILAIGGMVYLSRKPALELLQGNVQVKQKEDKTAQMAALDAMPKVAGAVAAPVSETGTFSAVPLPSQKSASGIAHTLRFVGCYIRRSKAKSALVFLLAALFTVGLAAIRVSIIQSNARVDELFNTVSVEMSLMPKNPTDYVAGGGFAAQKTVDAISDTGFARDVYLEGQCAVMRMEILEDGASITDDGGTVWNSGGAAARMISFDAPDCFLSTGSGHEIEIAYRDGWGAEMFAKDWSGSDTLPVLMPSYLYEAMNIPAGGRVALDILREDIVSSKVYAFEVAGTYTGTLTLGSSGDGRPCLLAPASVMDTVMQNHTAYSTARFALNPAWNRDLDTVRAAVEEILEALNAGLLPLRPMIWDEELTQAVEPLNDSIRLMEMLYPVALALSLLAAAGVSALMILTEACEAAIMRVLGTTKLRSRIILVLQIVFVALAGLLIGLAAALVWAGSIGLALAVFGMSALCAGAYLLCAVAGSTAGAVTVTNRPPLELLQVKE